MSLDIYLSNPMPKMVVCPYCDGRGETHDPDDEGHSQNVTHNLSSMAKCAGIYNVLWMAEETGITKAKQLIAPLGKAIHAMSADPERFRALDAENGWGRYDDFLPWLKRLLQACQEYPEYDVRISR